MILKVRQEERQKTEKQSHFANNHNLTVIQQSLQNLQPLQLCHTFYIQPNSS